MITLRYRSIDGANVRRQFTTLKGAQRYAQNMIGEAPEVAQAGRYAVSGDGIGKIVPIAGATLAELFPATVEPPAAPGPCHCEASQVYGSDCVHTLAGETEFYERLQAQEPWDDEGNPKGKNAL